MDAMKPSKIRMMRNRVAREKLRAGPDLLARFLTKSETAPEDGLDPTAEELGVV